MYKICKILTDILNPIAVNRQPFVENLNDARKTIAIIQVDKDNIKEYFVQPYSQLFQLIKHMIMSQRP